MADGWIKLSRQIQDNWMWFEEPFTSAQAWIDLLLLANYEDKKVPYRGQIIICKRGDVNMSFSSLARRWKWSRQKVSRFIGLLESDNMVTTDVTTKRTVITIVNYGKFQCSGSTDVTTDVTDDGQIVDITKKEKKEKNIKKFMPANKFVPSEQQNYDFEELERILSK